jgi:hypothetical protein
MRLVLVLCAALLASSPAAAQEKSPRETYEEMWRNTLMMFGGYMAAMECWRKEKNGEEGFTMMSLQDLGERDFNMPRKETGSIIMKAAEALTLSAKTSGKCPDDGFLVNWPKALAKTYMMRGAHLR